MNLQAIVKTFERPQCLARLLSSIERFYPDLIVWITDDSKEHYVSTNPRHRILKAPFDTGMSGGRQIALGCVQTEFFVLLDDDFEFVEETRLEELVRVAETTSASFVGGDVKDGDCKKGRFVCGRFWIENRILHGKPADPVSNGLIAADYIANFWVARTNDIRDMGGFDCRLKTGGHEEIFLRAKQHGKTVLFKPDVFLRHWPIYEKTYLAFRDRCKEGRSDFWWPIAKAEYGIDKCSP